MKKQSDLDKSRGGRIKYLRKEVLEFASQESFAAALASFTEREISRGAVGNWERGANIGVDNTRAVAAMAGTTFDWIMDGTGVAPKPKSSAVSIEPENGHTEQRPDTSLNFFDDPINRKRFENLSDEQRQRVEAAWRNVLDMAHPPERDGS